MSKRAAKRGNGNIRKNLREYFIKENINIQSISKNKFVPEIRDYITKSRDIWEEESELQYFEMEMESLKSVKIISSDDVMDMDYKEFEVFSTSKKLDIATVNKNIELLYKMEEELEELKIKISELRTSLRLNGFIIPDNLNTSNKSIKFILDEQEFAQHITRKLKV